MQVLSLHHHIISIISPKLVEHEESNPQHPFQKYKPNNIRVTLKLHPRDSATIIKKHYKGYSKARRESHRFSHIHSMGENWSRRMRVIEGMNEKKFSCYSLLCIGGVLNDP